MNPIRLLVLLAATLFAGPFHLGASWEWSVVFKGDSLKTIREKRSARIVDSIRDPSGPSTIWTFCVSDSTTKIDCDTAILAVDTVEPSRHHSGRARWIRGSMLLPLEPRPFSDLETLVTYPRTDFCQVCTDAGMTDRDSIPWGFGGSTGWLPSIHDPYDPLLKLWIDGRDGLLKLWKSPEWPFPLCYQCVFRGMENPQPFTLGSVDWDERLGWKRAIAFDKSWPIQTSSSAIWKLLSKDGLPILASEIGSAGRWLVPGVGEVRGWEFADTIETVNRMFSTKTSQQIRWTFLGRASDSDGVARNRIGENIETGSGTRQDSCEFRWILEGDSSWSSCTDRNPAGFFVPWYYRETDGFWWYGFADEYMTRLDGINLERVDRSTRYLRIHPLGGIDSSSTQSSSNLSGTWYGMNKQQLATQILLQANDSVVRAPAWTGVSSRIGSAKVPFDLREFAKAHPDATVKIVGADGRQRTRMARDLFGSGSGSSPRVGWFEVRLPDGSIQRGSFAR